VKIEAAIKTELLDRVDRSDRESAEHREDRRRQDLRVRLEKVIRIRTGETGAAAL
jgi:hypothetical protein